MCLSWDDLQQSIDLWSIVYILLNYFFIFDDNHTIKKPNNNPIIGLNQSGNEYCRAISLNVINNEECNNWIIYLKFVFYINIIISNFLNQFFKSSVNGCH
jgi:thioredoxin-related protein